jgi:hypothetical protein
MTIVRRLAPAVLIALGLPPGSARAATFTVTRTADTGSGSFRQALLDANALPGADTIAFKIKPYGVNTITPLSPLPAITEAVTIDAKDPNTKDHLVVLTGVTAGAGAVGLDVRGTGTVIHYLVVNHFSGCGIRLGGGGGHRLTYNYIGTDADGTAEVGNYEGVVVTSGDNTIGVGGRNVISGNAYTGVRIASGDRNQVQGNYVGPDRRGRDFVPSGTALQPFGIQVWSSRNTVNLNLIAGQRYGLYLAQGGSNVVVANTIGSTPDGATRLGNLASGIWVELGSSGNAIGSTVAAGANTVAHAGWQHAGIVVRDGTGNTIRGNRVHSLDPGAIAIDLFPPHGRTPNDPGDADAGANRLQNFPVVTEAVSDGVHTLVLGELLSAPGSAYVVDVYSTPDDPANGSCETRQYLGSVTVTTDATGRASFSLSSSTVVPWGEFVSATANAFAAGAYDTSEVSPCVPVRPPV